MNISYDKPPIWDEAKKAFDFDEATTVFTFGNTLYNPGKKPIPDHLLVHEETHSFQQKQDETVAKIWWQRYIADPAFRIDQEVEAYHAQYTFICGIIKDKNARYRNLHTLATHLCSPMYGSAISYTDAIRRIRN